MNEVLLLFDLKNLKEQLQHDLDRLAQLEALTTHTTQTLSDMPGSPNRRLDKLDSQMAAYLDYKTQVQSKCRIYVKVRKTVINAINQLPDQQERCVLLQKYVYFKSNTEISESLGLRDRQIEHLLRKATNHFYDRFQS